MIDFVESAEKVVDEIMILAQQLGGVISGEHGIGLTKYQYLSDKFKQDFFKYKNHIFSKKILLSYLWTDFYEIYFKTRRIL
jgi:FAD/FMN-containing dehydrogenase